MDELRAIVASIFKLGKGSSLTRTEPPSDRTTVSMVLNFYNSERSNPYKRLGKRFL